MSSSLHIIGAASGSDKSIIKEASKGPGSSTSKLEKLLNGGANANALRNDGSGWSALMIASFGGNEGAVRALLSHGADPNAKDKDGMSCLMYAAYGGYKNICKMLLQKGATSDVMVEVEGFHPATATVLAREQGHHEVADMIESFNAELSHSEL